MFGFNLGSIKAYLKLNIDNWQKGHRVVSSDVRTLGREIAAMGAVVTGAMTVVVREFGQFDRAIRESLAVSEQTEEQFASMSRMAEDMSVELNKAATETATAFYFLGSAGLSATEQMQSYNTTVKLSRALTEAVGTTAEGLVDVMKAFNIEFSHSAEVGDIVTKTITSSNQVFSDLDKALSYVASTANLMNNSLAETSAVLGVMANAGIKGSMAGVALRRAITNLMSPTSEMRDLLYELNVEVFDRATGKAKPFIDAFGEMAKAVQGTTEEYRNMVFEVLFGRRAIAGMIKVFDYGTDALKKYVGELEDSAGTMDRITKKQMAAFLNQLGQIWRQVQRLARAIGRELAPVIQKFGDYLKERLSVLEDWIDANKELVVKLAKTVTTFGLLATVIGPLLYILPNMVLSIGLLATAFSALALPLVTVLAGWYVLRAAFNVTLNDMVESFGQFKDYFSSWAKNNMMGRYFTQTLSQIMWEFSLIPDVVKSAFSKQSMLNTILYFIKALQQAGLAARTVIAASYFDFKEVGKLSTEIAKINEEMRLLLLGTPKQEGGLGAYFNTVFGSEEEMNASYKVYVNQLSNVVKFTGEMAEKSWDKLKEIGTSGMNMFRSDLDDLFTLLKSKIPGLADLFNIFNSRSAVLVEFKPLPSMEGLFTGFGGGGKAYANQFAERWETATQATLENFSTMREGIVDIFEDIQSGWETAFKDLMQQGSSFGDFMDALFNSIYQSFVNFTAKMLSQSLFEELFGAGLGTGRTRGPLTLGTLLGDFNPSSWTGGIKMDYGSQAPFGQFANQQSEFIGSSSIGQFATPKIAININNNGLPVDLAMDSTEMNGESMVLNASMKLAASNTNYRRMFVNKG